ncbi:MAG: 30S ribosomal protein S9 [Bacteroidetes bacterium]|nr:30S ribosomal protein S9 [Bacteroidota bacterium]
MYTIATGRRKAAIARVYLKAGKGKIEVNGKDYKEFFPVKHLINKIEEPFKVTETEGKYDVKVNAVGGGIKGQAEALALGIARALIEIDAELKPVLKDHKLVTRDPRVVERKKPGKKKARKSFQFSKR